MLIQYLLCMCTWSMYYNYLEYVCVHCPCTTTNWNMYVYIVHVLQLPGICVHCPCTTTTWNMYVCVHCPCTITTWNMYVYIVHVLQLPGICMCTLSMYYNYLEYAHCSYNTAVSCRQAKGVYTLYTILSRHIQLYFTQTNFRGFRGLSYREPMAGYSRLINVKIAHGFLNKLNL